MKQKVKDLFIISLISIVPTLLLWFPFFFRFKSFWNIPLPTQGMATIVANFDGPLYIVTAKTLYNPSLIGTNFQFPLSNEYYSAHFPLYPLAIRLFSYILGYPYAMLFVSLVSSIAALYIFYLLLRNHTERNGALWLTFLFSIFPARWLIVRSVGSPEPLFIALIMASIYFFSKKKYLFAGIYGFFAQMTKSPAILLFVGYVIEIVLSNIHSLKRVDLKKYIPLILIPLGVLAVFSIYKLTYNDFFVYFKSGDNMHLFFPPFQIFNYSAPWVGTFWLEEVIFIYAIGALGVYKLYKEKMYNYFFFAITFFIPLLFVAHRDLLRYSIPLIPFLFLGFNKELQNKEFKYLALLLIIPIYLYSLAFISQNAMPISNWTPFL